MSGLSVGLSVRRSVCRSVVHSPITWGSTFDVDELKMSIFPAQNVSRFVFVLAARAEANILHAVDVERQTKWCPAMSSRDERKYGCGEMTNVRVRW